MTAKRLAAAKRFFDKAMATNGDPDKVAMDKSCANKVAMYVMRCHDQFYGKRGISTVFPVQ